MSKSDASFPEFIHIGRQEGSPAGKASHPPPSTPPPNSLYKTPTKVRAPRRGILKSPSYKFTTRPAKSPQASTPTTVGTNESLDDEISRSSSVGSSTVGSAGTFGTTSSEGIKKAIDRIIRDRIKIKKSSRGGNDDSNQALRSSASSESLASASTSSTSESTSSTASVVCTKEEWQRCARIKHIENLRERINAAKARKLVVRKAYRREDKLMLRMARQLKMISKCCRENAINIQMLEESNQFAEDCYNRCLQNLEELRARRIALKERLLTETNKKLEEDREQRERILRVQNSEMQAHTMNHQSNCQELCVSVFEANNELDRLRALWDQHIGQNSSSSKDGESSRSKRLKKASQATNWVVVLVVVFAIAAFVFLPSTVGGIAADAAVESLPRAVISKDQPQQVQHQPNLPQSVTKRGTASDDIASMDDLDMPTTESPEAIISVGELLDGDSIIDFSSSSVMGSSTDDDDDDDTKTTRKSIPKASTATERGKKDVSFDDSSVNSRNSKTHGDAANTKTSQTQTQQFFPSETPNRKGKKGPIFKPKEAVASIARHFRK